MPNNGQFWTDEETSRLIKDYTETKSETTSEFCKEWGGVNGWSVTAVNGKITMLIRAGLLEKRKFSKVRSGEEERDEATIDYEDNFINIVCASRRIRTQEDAIKEFGVDMEKWRVVKCKIKTSEGYRKDRKVDWHVTDGHVTKGDVEDSGMMLVVPLYHVEVRLERRVQEIRARLAIEDMLKEAQGYAPKYPKITYKKYKNGCLYEPCIPDIHFGRLTWDKETGEDYDIKIAQQALEKVVNDLLAAVKDYEVSRILFPIGNDYFNVNSKTNTTVNGTPQSEDTRWQKTFVLGRELAVKVIEACSSIAPVDVVVIPGNHDEEKSFYMGDALSCWFHNNPNVSVDNSPRSRKYYLYGKNLIGLSHGDIKTERLPFLMAQETPELWAQSTVREWHVGHLHTKKGARYEEDESNGVLVRTLRSIAAQDAWTFNNGFVSRRAAEAFLWKKDGGILAQFTATP